MTFFIFAAAPLLLSHLVLADFGYDGTNGPSNWGEHYGECLGKYQSPIDIEDKDVTNATFPLLEFSGIDKPYEAVMTNNGHTVMIQASDTDVPTVSGGPLNDTYVFQQLHFHWGQNDNIGSEDLINNHSFSMELHAVFYKKAYGSSAEAMKQPDGLTVLGYLYQAADEPNPVFDTIVPQIPDIVALGSNVTINNPDVLSKLIAPDVESAQSYYTYKGSLTTPPCLEIVQWIDFTKPQPISHDQLAAFRKIQSSDGSNLTHNFRPVQPLDGRVVYRNILDATTTTSGVASTSTASGASTTTSVSPSPTTKEASTAATTASTTMKNTKTDAPATVSSTTAGAPESKNGSQHSGQGRIWTISPVVVLFGIVFFLPYD